MRDNRTLKIAAALIIAWVLGIGSPAVIILLIVGLWLFKDDIFKGSNDKSDNKEDKN